MVETPIFELAGTTKFLNELKKTDSVLQPSDMADGVVYVLSTPPHVQVSSFTIESLWYIHKFVFQIHELTIRAVGENF